MNRIEPFDIKNKQKRTPKETHQIIGTFIGLVENDINNAKARKTKNPKPSLTKEEKTAMEALAERTDIILTNADKGEAVIIMNTDYYINEAKSQLIDQDNYKQLPNDPYYNK